jgi:hypothetical protein
MSRNFEGYSQSGLRNRRQRWDGGHQLCRKRCDGTGGDLWAVVERRAMVMVGSHGLGLYDGGHGGGTYIDKCPYPSMRMAGCE